MCFHRGPGPAAASRSLAAIGSPPSGGFASRNRCAGRTPASSLISARQPLPETTPARSGLCAGDKVASPLFCGSFLLTITFKARFLCTRDAFGAGLVSGNCNALLFSFHAASLRNPRLFFTRALRCKYETAENKLLLLSAPCARVLTLRCFLELPPQKMKRKVF